MTSVRLGALFDRLLGGLIIQDAPSILYLCKATRSLIWAPWHIATHGADTRLDADDSTRNVGKFLAGRCLHNGSLVKKISTVYWQWCALEVYRDDFEESDTPTSPPLGKDFLGQVSALRAGGRAYGLTSSSSWRARPLCQLHMTVTASSRRTPQSGKSPECFPRELL